MVITDPQKIDAVLNRAVANVYPSKEALREALLSGKKLKLYTGIDPTSPDMHIGHVIWLWKLREFQELGHEVIMLFGSFTAMIGDPTGKASTRKQLTLEEVKENTKTYKRAASSILSFRGRNSAKVMWNHKWFSKMKLGDVLPLMSEFTVQQLMERDMFQKRLAEAKPIGFHEFMYPLLQGYDSVAMNVDLEIGGNDQTFNMLAGRTLQRSLKNREKFVLTVPLLETSDGKKMGKSEGNAIPILSEPGDLFGKIMALEDGFIFPLFELATRVPMERIESMKEMIKNGGNPRDAKLMLAEELVAQFSGGPRAAKAARQHFETIFQKHEMPTDMPVFNFDTNRVNVVELLVKTGLASSNSEARRLVEQGGVKADQVMIARIDAEVEIKVGGTIVQKGKRHWVKVTCNKC